MNNLRIFRPWSRILNSRHPTRCFSAESTSSAGNAGQRTVEETLKERNRTTEPRLTKGEVFSRANLAPQVYETSYEDNYQRTTVEDIDTEMRESKRNCVSSYSEIGFEILNDTLLIGPVAIFPKTVLSWRVKNVDDITPQSMLLFTIMEPKLDIVVVGVGDKKFIRPVKERLQPLFRKHHILLEVLDTPDACATFNFLNREGRYVAAALFPALEVIPELPRSRINLEHVNTSDRGMFGLSNYDSENPLQEVKMFLEDTARRRKAKGYDTGESDLAEEKEKPK